MTYLPRILFSISVLCCAVLVFAVQAERPSFDRELEAAKQAIGQNNYMDAMSHFTKANEISQGKCSECYVWLARLDLAAGKLDEARANAEKGVATAKTDTEKWKAQLYLGTVFGRQNEFAEAEAAFRAASAVNPSCLECKFNLGFILLKESKDAEGVAVLKSIAPEFAGTPRGREMQRFIEDPSRVRKNYAPEFSAKSRSGEEFNLDKLRGKVVLLDFWGTWCAPCRVSLPEIKDLAAKVDRSKVAIISVDEGDSRENWDRFVQANGMNWPQVYDGDRSLYRSFNVDGYPRYYVLSKDGIILAAFKGWRQTGAATISDAINAALKQ